MRRVTVSAIGILFLLLTGCSSEEPSAPVNPRLAKSGQQLASEPAVPVANDSSESLSPEQKTVIPAPATAQSETPPLTEAQKTQLIARARAGNADAQVELGNAFFEGNGMAQNRAAAEFWWRQAAQQRHPAAISNLQMANTKPEEGVSFFGTPSKGDRFVFIIDKSGSMRAGSRFAKAKAELIRVLRALPKNSRFMVYFFAGDAEPMPANAMLAAVPENIRFAEKWINSRAFGRGGTEPSDALRFTFNLKPDTVWLLTDGRFSNEGAVVNQIRRANPQKKVRINTLALMDQRGEPVLKQIANENDGTYRFVKN